MRKIKKNHLLLLILTIITFILFLFNSQKEKIAEVTASVNRVLPIYCVSTQKPYIALTFDAAWGNEDTQTILSILEKHNVKATFFMTGGWVKSYPEDVKAILAAGHDLGNHSENHLNMSQLSQKEKEEELMLVHNRVKQLTDYEMFLFRPPYGDYDEEVVNCAKNCNYYTIQWDVDTLVTKGKGIFPANAGL